MTRSVGKKNPRSKMELIFVLNTFLKQSPKLQQAYRQIESNRVHI